MYQNLERGGMVIGPSHAEGGVPFVLQDTGTHIEEEGMEINIPRELSESDQIFTFYGTNAKVLDEILKLAGLSITDRVTNVRSGDIVICVRSAWDDTNRKFTGTITEILNKINTSGGCNPLTHPIPIGHPDHPYTNSPIRKYGGKLPKGIKLRVKDWQAEDPNSPRWKKKKERIEQLSNSIQGLRMNVSKDLTSDDEKKVLTAIVVAVMDRTAERIGNDDSADNGHFGVTGFRKKHISVIGSKVHLEYVGKSGTKHEKSFSDERIAKALKKAIKNAPGKFIFETSDGFRIKSDKVNRYLEPFKISAKDLRGYNANRWIVQKLSHYPLLTTHYPEKDKKERKRNFNKTVKEVALRVGHGTGTLKKHYMIPELPIQYIEYGNIIDMKNLGYYKEGGAIENKIKRASIENTFKNPIEEAVNFELLDESSKLDNGLNELMVSLPIQEVAIENIIPTQEFVSKERLIQGIKSTDKLPLLIKWKDKYYVEDGHHRIILNVLNNQPIMARVFDRNKYFKANNGGSIQEHQPCSCFSAHLKEQHPQLCEQITEGNINSNPELRSQVDEAYQQWNGGKN